ncbi:Nitric oxide synthase-interacting protein [Tolypocladium ophioglossoides CBS 100239]|uniref:Nitric oxide synthase-interacting protein n=1 Tax=Tolypocladium ophioglossoides (strain CBS 100239) TaxID=1163406 RepID=A0A0L0NF07_TOLOC|nr:Nitric oxide synthase-interacting protein [Tolypocladium ophioglossoides CBS 100239]
MSHTDSQPLAGKRNTSRAVFTSHERALAKSNWATNSARLNRDSFLQFGSCGLCLGTAREPVSCPHGDIFCRECALENLVTQKKELKRAEKGRRDAELEAERIKAIEDEEDRERAIRDFEMTQAGLSANKKKTALSIIAARDIPSDAVVLHAASKRKFALDEDELRRIATEDRIKARRAIEDEKAAKPTLPSFWTPALTPDVQDSKLPAANKQNKVMPICPSSPDDSPHPISMQKLVTIHFNEEAQPTSQDKRRTCPSCLKALSNSSNPVMTEQCGHVLCMSCVKKFLIPPSKSSTAEAEAPMMCYVCDTPVEPKSSKKTTGSNSSLPPGLVMLKSEGTGFSARGSSTVEKSGVAFQC